MTGLLTGSYHAPQNSKHFDCGIVQMLTEDYPTIRNIVFLVGVLYLLRLMVWSLLSLWSGTKAFFLTGLFKVDLKSYGWAGE